MRNQTIEVGISGEFNVKRAPVNIIDSLIIEQNNNISVFEKVGDEIVVKNGFFMIIALTIEAFCMSSLQLESLFHFFDLSFALFV